MESRQLLGDEQLEFAHAAMTVRYPDMAQARMQPNLVATVTLLEVIGTSKYVLARSSVPWIPVARMPATSSVDRAHRYFPMQAL
jgi:hypothetical protein